MNLLDNQDNQAPTGTDANQPPAAGNVPPPAAPAPPPPAPSGRGADTGAGLRVSLMPEEEEAPGSGLRRWLLILFAVLLIETLAIGGGYFYLTNQEANLLEDKNAIEQSLNGVVADIKKAEAEAQEAALFDARAIIAGERLDEHLFWTRFFEYLGTQTKKNVNYLNFAGDFGSRTVSMDAVAKTYRDVAEQIVVLRENPVIEGVITTSAAAKVSEMGGVEGVSFSLVITLQPEVWLQQGVDNDSQD